MQRPAGSGPHAAPRGAPRRVAAPRLRRSHMSRACSSGRATTYAAHMEHTPRCTTATACVSLDFTSSSRRSGGRIDPPGEKTTFGFHVDARDWCRSGGPIKGLVHSVIHPTKTRIHSVSIDDFSSFQDPDRGGRCAAFSGTARVKDGHGSWRQERFGVIACDNGPRCSSRGPGPDRYGISLEDGRETGVTDLRGGNIHAHGGL